MPTKLTDKEKLAAGAADIRKAEADSKAAAVTDKELKPTRDIKDVLRDKVTMLDGHIGLTLKEDTTLAENLQVLGYVIRMGDHVQFMIGDVLNHGEFKFGEKKYSQALLISGLARRTLQEYSQTARLIPASKRIAALPFTHHRVLITLGKEPPKLDQVLKDLAKQNGDIEVADVRAMVKKLTPKKSKPVKKPTAKGKKGVTAQVELEELTTKEESVLIEVDAALDAAIDALTNARPIIFNVKKYSNDDKEDLADELEFFVKFHTDVVKRTGTRR